MERRLTTPPIGIVHRVLLALHARGFHPAVLAGLVMMPAVVAVGFWAGDPAPKAPSPALSDLRGSLTDPAPSLKADRRQNAGVPAALRSE